MRLLLLFILLAGTSSLYAQQKNTDADTSDVFLKKKSVSPVTKKEGGQKATIKALVIPLSFITYGVVSQTSEDLREFDLSVKTEVRKKDPDFHTPFDNYLQYAPAAAVYALNAMGIKGKHDFKDRTATFMLSTIISGITVQSIKAITQVRRPDGFGTNAFPSGHTATAFAGAEFLYQEYKDISPWYGIAGYSVATATGILRMYNNKHWFRDVMAGAGFGILSTRIAYWLEPKIARLLFHKKATDHFDPGNY